MATADYSWIYFLIFLVIPLSRILPRLLRRAGLIPPKPTQTLVGGQIEQSSGDTVQEHTRDPSRPQTKNMLVLAELNRGTKSFERVKKNIGIDGNQLNSILKDLEKRGLIRVEQKQGPFGTKIELYATKRGRQEFYS